MHTCMSKQFKEEVKKYNLVFACEDCDFWFNDKKKCSINYPSHFHEKTTVDSLEDGDRMYFCKMFESS